MIEAIKFGLNSKSVFQIQFCRHFSASPEVSENNFMKEKFDFQSEFEILKKVSKRTCAHDEERPEARKKKKLHTECAAND